MKITALPDGPIKIEGTFTVHDAGGKPLQPHKPSTTTTAYLCRCGHSQKKPWCDASHGQKQWKAP